MNNDIGRERAQAFLDEYKELCAKHAIEVGVDFAGSPVLDVFYPQSMEKLHLHLLGCDWYLSSLD